MKYTRNNTVNPAVVTHCHRELFHEQWKILLDDEFMAAYEDGVVIRCGDGVEHRWFPRILTYSADYPEKCVTYDEVVMLSFTNTVLSELLLPVSRI
jgi:hypothetical protein